MSGIVNFARQFLGVLVCCGIVLCSNVAHAGFASPATLFPDGSTTRTGTELAVAAGAPAQYGAAWTFVTTATVDFGVQFGRTANSGGTWSSPIDVSQSTFSGDSGDKPTIATDGANTWIIAWDSDKLIGNSLDPSRDIYFARSTDAGLNWSPPAILNSNSADTSISNTAPSLATDGAGKWVAVWETVSAPPANVAGDYYLSVSTSSDNGVSWTAPAMLASNMPSDLLNDEAPRICTDKQGNWLTVWQTRSTSGTALLDIYGAKSTNNGASWSPPARISRYSGGSDVGYDLQPRITNNGGAQWVVVWTSYDTLNGATLAGPNILAAKSTDSGTTFSTPSAVNSDAASGGGACASPDVTYANASYVATWDEVTGGIHQVRYAQSADGTNWSTAQAIANTLPTATQGFRPQIASESTGAAMAIWAEGADDHVRRLMYSYAPLVAHVDDWAMY